MGKSGSSSQANQASTTVSNDDRIVNESGLVARDSALDLSSHVNDNSTNNLAYTTNTDTTSGSYNTTADPLIAKAAFEYGAAVDATAGRGMTEMLGFAKELTGKSQESAFSLAKLFGEQSSNQSARFQDNVLQAFDSARTTTPGGIDNKTMIILGVAAAGALAIASRKGT